MPSHTFLLSKPNTSNPGENLPVYTRTSSSTPAYLNAGGNPCALPLPTILEMAEDGDEVDNDYSTRPPPAFLSSWDLSRLLKIEYAAMMPQALLVDASATLCAYLYFTSLQARLALQGQASLDILSSVCNSMPVDADVAVTQICSKAIEKAQTVMTTSDISSSVLLSHHFILAMVLIKAFFGYSVMKLAPRYIRPFDYLVASGAAHCLILYFAFFVPVANALSNGATDSSVWLRVMTKFFWLLIACSCIGLAHWIASTSLHNPTGTIELAAEDASLITEKTPAYTAEEEYLDDKDAILIA